jgi:hypothetical protein
LKHLSALLEPTTSIVPAAGVEIRAAQYSLASQSGPNASCGYAHKHASLFDFTPLMYWQFGALLLHLNSRLFPFSTLHQLFASHTGPS